MFNAKQTLMLQVGAAVVIIFFLALIGGTGGVAALLWGLIVGLVLLLVRRQNMIVAEGKDVLREGLSHDFRTTSAFVRETLGLGSPAMAARPAEPAAPSDEASRPPALEAPSGEPDDLKRINGVGPKLEGKLNELGYYHFSQIAKWTQEEVAWIDQSLVDFKGRASRDNWVAQARSLMGDS